MPTELVVLGITWFVVFLFSTTLHEAGHAFAAYRLGDPTAYHGGQVSLNPLPHVQREPMGMVVVPILSFLLTRGAWMMGWASAPYDPAWAVRHHRRAAVMAAAGPAANLLLVLLSGLGIRLGLMRGIFQAPKTIPLSITHLTEATGEGLAAAFVTPLSILFSLNLILFVFNLLPLPPLDGSALPPIFLSAPAAERYLEFLHQPMFALVGLVVAWRLFNPIFEPVLILALKLLYS